MIQATTYLTYWFTVANIGQKKPFHQLCISLSDMFEDHEADFIERSLPGHGVYREYGAESIHEISRLLHRTYCSMQPAMRRLQSMLKKNIID